MFQDKILFQEPLSVARAKTLLERASSGGHLPAIYLLVDLLEREGANDRAVDLLKVIYLLVFLLEREGANDRAVL